MRVARLLLFSEISPQFILKKKRENTNCEETSAEGRVKKHHVFSRGGREKVTGVPFSVGIWVGASLFQAFR